LTHSSVNNNQDCACRCPELTGDYSLDPAQIEQYKRNGHLYLPNVAVEQEINGCRTQLLETIAINQTTANIRFLRSCAQKIIHSPRFAKICAELMGVDAVRIYRDSIFIKKPGEGHTPWHQDSYLTLLDTDHIITMWMPLYDIPTEMGSLSFITGSHTLNDRTRHAVQNLVMSRRRGYPITTYPSIKAGDATFHSGWTLHAAPHNPTEHTRYSLGITYFSADARIIKTSSYQPENHLMGAFQTLKPGDLVDGPDNPIIWRNES